MIIKSGTTDCHCHSYRVSYTSASILVSKYILSGIRLRAYPSLRVEFCNSLTWPYATELSVSPVYTQWVQLGSATEVPPFRGKMGGKGFKNSLRGCLSYL